LATSHSHQYLIHSHILLAFFFLNFVYVDVICFPMKTRMGNVENFHNKKERKSYLTLIKNTIRYFSSFFLLAMFWRVFFSYHYYTPFSSCCTFSRLCCVYTWVYHDIETNYCSTAIQLFQLCMSMHSELLINMCFFQFGFARENKDFFFFTKTLVKFINNKSKYSEIKIVLWSWQLITHN
jgi:hypothetical protein